MSKEVLATITISGSVLNSATFGTFADVESVPYFSHGHVIATFGTLGADGTDIRWITFHDSGDNITLQFPFDSRLSDGDEVKVYPGCSKQVRMCITKFGNFDIGADNKGFLGMPYVPSSNPVVWGV